MKFTAQAFLKNIAKLEKTKHFECFYTYMISPVIMGIKPAMTISIDMNDLVLFKDWISRVDESDIKHIRLKTNKEKIILLVYREDVLKDFLSIRENKDILVKTGYKESYSLLQKLELLKLKMTTDDFPHEIGLFLGIPACDVNGFLNNQKCIHCGYWKVYKNAEETKKTFKLYDSSKNFVMKNILEGKNLDEVIEKIKYKNNTLEYSN